MNFYINIIDTTNDSFTTVIEQAQRNSIVLNYKGDDAKDELKVVGSDLRFTLEVLHNINDDAVYAHLFTPDETKYKIELRREDNDALIWNGFLLPDSYDEPYESGTYYVDFLSTDGLGRLKGKLLAAEFYEDEKSVVEIISACLRATGLEMPIVFAPGVDNYIQKDWNQIYIDGSTFVEKDDPLDVYSILETLAKDMVFCVYQHLGVWRVEGLNKRELLSYNAKRYTFDGVFVSNEVVEKVVKIATNQATPSPNITMVPSVHKVTVLHERIELSLPETALQEANDGWVNAAGVIEEVYSTDWFGHNDFFAKAKAPDYKLFLLAVAPSNYEPESYISLNKKIFLGSGVKIKLVFDFVIKTIGDPNNNTIEGYIDNGYWTNPFDYKIKLNDDVLFTNTGANISVLETVEFSSDKKASIFFEFIASQDGLFDIEFYQPKGSDTEGNIQGIFVDKLEFEEIAFTENYISEETINADQTILKEIELDYADDKSGFSKAFRLAKLNVTGSDTNLFQIPILYGFTQNGNNYSVVSLANANLIADNIDFLNWNDTVNEQLVIVNNASVIYNLNNGEQMVVKTDTLYEDSNFLIVQRRTNDYDLSRDLWNQWTDSVYEIERLRYADAVKNIYKRLFLTPQPAINLNVMIPVLFGDLVQFNYEGDNYYVVTSSKLNFDTGETTLSISRNNYLGNGNEIPPIVDAGVDQTMSTEATQINVSAIAYDPDGVIVSYLWEIISGGSGTIINDDQANTLIVGLTGDSYVIKVTVTDDDGLTASDTLNVVRFIDYTMSLSLQSEIIDASGTYQSNTSLYRIVVTPPIPASETINVSFLYSFELDKTFGSGEVNSSFRLIKNNNSILIDTYALPQQDPSVNHFEQISSVFNINANDVIDLQLFSDVQIYNVPVPDITSTVEFIISNAALFSNGQILSGLPLNESIIVTSDV